MLKHRVLKLLGWSCIFNLRSGRCVKILTIPVAFIMLSAFESAESIELDSGAKSASFNNWSVAHSTDEFDRPIPNSDYARFRSWFSARYWSSGSYFGALQVSPVITKDGDMHITMRRSRLPGDQEIPINGADPYLAVVLRNDGTKALYNADAIDAFWVIRGQHPRGFNDSASLIQILLADMSGDVEFYIVGGGGGRKQEFRFSITPEDRAGLKEVLHDIGAI